MPFDSTNADLSVIPVKTPAELKRFIALPARLNAKDPNWITPLFMERTEALTPKTNPFFAHAEVQLFLATREEMENKRIDEVSDNVFHKVSRINSTWGGNLVDMVRSRRILETIAADGLFGNAAEQGGYLRDLLHGLAAEFPGTVLDVRGRGLMCAFTLPSAAERDELVQRLWTRGGLLIAAPTWFTQKLPKNYKTKCAPKVWRSR